MDTFFTSTVLQKETYIFIILGVVLKHRSTYLLERNEYIY